MKFNLFWRAVGKVLDVVTKPMDEEKKREEDSAKKSSSSNSTKSTEKPSS